MNTDGNLKFQPLPNRDAWATVRGYLFQAELTVLRWLELGEGQFLELECGEDIDIVSVAISEGRLEERILEQVKHRDRGISLRQSSVVSAICAATIARNRNPGIDLRFRFTSNASFVQERNGIAGRPAIKAWSDWQRGFSDNKDDLAVIRRILSEANRPKGFNATHWLEFRNWLNSAEELDFVKFIERFEWSSPYQGSGDISQTVVAKLVESRMVPTTANGAQVFDRLLLKVIKTLSQPGTKRLSRSELKSTLDSPLLSAKERSELDALRANVVLPLLVMAREFRIQKLWAAEARYRGDSLPFLAAETKEAQAIDLLLSLQRALIPTSVSSRRVFAERAIWANSGRRIVSTDRGGQSLRVWCSKSYRLVAEQRAHLPVMNREGPYGTITGLVADAYNDEVIYTCGIDQTVRRWIIGSNLKESAIRKLDSKCLALSHIPHPGRSRVIVGCHDGSVHLLDAVTFDVLASQLESHSLPIRSISASGRDCIATADSVGCICLWDRNLELRLTLEFSAQVRALSFSDDGKLLFVGGESNDLEVFRTADGQRVQTLAGHTSQNGPDGALTLDFCWVGRERLLTCGSDGQIRDWTLKNSPSFIVLGEHGQNNTGSKAVRSIEYDAKSNRILSVGADCSIAVWNLNERAAICRSSGFVLRTPESRCHTDLVSSFAASAGLIATGAFSLDSYFRIHDTPSCLEAMRFNNAPELKNANELLPVHAIALSSDGKLVATANDDGNITLRSTDRPDEILWSVTAHKVFEIPRSATGERVEVPRLSAAALVWNNNQLISSGYDHVIRIFNAESGELQQSWNAAPEDADPKLLVRDCEAPEDSRLISIASPDDVLVPLPGDRLLSAGSSGTVRIWCISDGQLLMTIPGMHSPVTCADWSLERELWITGHSDGSLLLRDTSSSSILAHFKILPVRFHSDSFSDSADDEPLPATILSVAISSKNRIAAVACGDGSNCVIDLKTEEVIARGIGNESPANLQKSSSIHFTQAGELISVDSDLAIRHWDFGAAAMPFLSRSDAPTFDQGFWRIRPLPDSQWVSSTGKELWIGTHENLRAKRILSLDSDQIWNLDTSPDGSILVGTYFGYVRRLTTDGEQQLLEHGPPVVDSSKRSESIVALAPDSSLAAFSKANSIVIWNQEAGSPHSVMELPEPDLHSLGISEVSLKEGQLFARFVSSISFSPNGIMLAAATEYGEIFVWEISNPSQPSLRHHLCKSPHATSISFSADGSCLFQAGAAGLDVWDVAHGIWHRKAAIHEPAPTRQGNRSRYIWAISTNESTGQYATLGADDCVRVWNSELKQKIAISLSTITKGAPSLNPLEKRLTIQTVDIGLRIYRDLAFSFDGGTIVAITDAGDAIMVNCAEYFSMLKTILANGSDFITEFTNTKLNQRYQIEVLHRNHLETVDL